MADEVKKEIELEIAHVLFIDTVGYSKLLIDDQRNLIDTLKQVVRGTDEFGNAKLPQRFKTLQKRRTRLRWVATTAALLALAMIIPGVVMFSRYRERSTLAAPEKSIAVLPFENLSEEKANAYFAEGIQN